MLRASANFSSILNLGSVVLFKNCHADLRAVVLEYPILWPSSSNDKPDLSKIIRARPIASNFLSFTTTVYY